MTFWELFVALASAASIVSLAVALGSIYNGRATRQLIREMQAETRQLLDRIDARADERHREVIEAIRALRA